MKKGKIMKREYLIGGLFLLVILGLLIGVTFLGGPPAKSPQTAAIAPTPRPQTVPTAILKEDPNQALALQPNNNAQIASASAAIQSASKEEFWIAGYVTGEDGKVLPGTKVSVYIMDGIDKNATRDGDEGTVVQRITDDKGYYTIPLKEPHEYQVTSEPPAGYLTLVERITLTQEHPNQAMHFVHPLAPFTVKGKVIDSKTKAPIAGAEVILIINGRDHHPKQRIERSKSAADGTFTITRIAKGSFRLEAHAKGYIDFMPYRDTGKNSGLNNIEVSEKTQNKEYTIEMDPGFAATFHVVNAMGQPVAGAFIKITGEETEYDYIGNSETDTNGTVTNDTLPQRRLYAEASKEKEGRGFSKPFEPGTPDQPTLVEIKLAGSASVSGQVVDKEGKPVSDYEVVAEIKDLEGWTYPPSENREPDKEGKYTIADLAPGSYRVFLAKSHTFPKRAIQAITIELKAGDAKTGVDFILDQEKKKQETTELKGIVLDEETNEPVEGVHVYAVVYNKGDILGNEGNTTDAKGEFLIPKSAKGGDEIQFSLQDKEGYAHTIVNRPTNQDYYTLKIKKSGLISGIVIDPDNKPIADARVTPIRYFGNSPNPMDYFAKSTGNDGTFEFTNLDPMDYSFSAKAEGYAITKSAKVSLKEGESIDSVVITMEKGVEITGVVLDPQGQPLPDAILSIYSHIVNNNGHSWSDRLDKQNFPENARTDGAGKFTISDFPPQGDVLVVRHDKLSPAKMSVTADMLSQPQPQPVTIQMTPGGILMGTVYGSDGKGISGVTIMTQNFPENLFRYETRTDKEGKYQFENLLPASYMVINNGAPQETSGKEINGSYVIIGNGGTGLENQQYKNTAVEEGKTTRCDFNGGEGATIHGVVYKRGQIAPNAHLGLECRSSAPEQIGNFLKTYANEQGVYSFQSVSTGVWTLTVNTKADGSIDSSQCEYSTVITVTQDQTDYNVDLYIASVEIQGTVLDQDSNEPISGVTIQPQFGMGAKRPQGWNQLGATSDAEGKFSILPQESGDYIFTAVKDGYALQQFSVNVPSNTPGQAMPPLTVDVRMEKDNMGILLRLMLDGKPATAAWVQAYIDGQNGHQRLQVTDQGESGVYRAVGMPEGEMQLSVMAYCRAKVMSSLPQNVIVRKGEVSQVLLDLMEIKDYPLILHTPKDETLNGVATIELLDMPDSPPQRIPIQTRADQTLKNIVLMRIPSTVKQVRLSVEGFQPMELNTDALLQQAGGKDDGPIHINLIPM